MEALNYGLKAREGEAEKGTVLPMTTENEVDSAEEDDEKTKYKKYLDLLPDENSAFKSMTLAEMRSERASNAEKISAVQNEISDMAFQNYRTYADVGRMADHCMQMFCEMNQLARELNTNFGSLLESSRKFRADAPPIEREFGVLDSVTATNSKVWQLIKLPMLMERFIRAGQYEKAFTLTNFAVNLQQSKAMQIPMVKTTVNKLIEARHGLLDELFNKFAGPIDLAKSVQVINNIRKIPYTSNTQLRISLLQYRDLYLEKRVQSLMSEKDFLLRLPEVYREVMYETMVLYLAVFPPEATSETLPQQKLPQFAESKEFVVEEPRYERWYGGIKNYLLNIWVRRNIDQMFSHIRSMVEQNASKEPDLQVKDIELEAVVGKLMSFGFSLGRMGYDFRHKVIAELTEIITRFFQLKVDAAVSSFTSLKRLDMLEENVFGDYLAANQSPELAEKLASTPLELSTWDDLCVFGNALIDALNDSRHSLYAPMLDPFFTTLKGAFQQAFQWLDGFLFPPTSAPPEKGPAPSKKSTSPHSSRGASPAPSSNTTTIQRLQPVPESLVRRAATLILGVFLPHMGRLFRDCFPYDQCVRRVIFRTEEYPPTKYEESYSFVSPELFRLCRREDFFRAVLDEVLETKKHKAEEEKAARASTQEQKDKKTESIMEEKEEKCGTIVERTADEGSVLPPPPEIRIEKVEDEKTVEISAENEEETF